MIKFCFKVTEMKNTKTDLKKLSKLIKERLNFLTSVSFNLNEEDLQKLLYASSIIEAVTDKERDYYLYRVKGNMSFFEDTKIFEKYERILSYSEFKDEFLIYLADYINSSHITEEEYYKENKPEIHESYRLYKFYCMKRFCIEWNEKQKKIVR